MKQRVIFLVKSAKTPSSRIRIGDMVPYLEAKDIQSEVEFIPKSFLQRHKLFRKCAHYDLVVLQKRLFSWFEFSELRKNAARLAFDFDDAVYLKNSSPSYNNSDYQSSTRLRRFKRIIQAADLVIAANAVLATEAGEYTKTEKIKIIPSSVNLQNTRPKDDFKLASPAVIGWVGSKVTHRYLEFLAPQLGELAQKEDFVLKIISDKNLEISGVNVENVQWSLEEENCEIRKFDIGIMPLSDDPFSAGKASYKLLQYLAAGIPSVASAVGMNKEVAGNDQNALLAGNPVEFKEKLSLLLKDEKLRSKIGQNGRKLIEEKYSRDVVGAQFAEVIANAVKAN